jgi:cystathionine gamma-synthase/cystathionine gamma-lyase/cystathionine beta-lyase
MGLAMQIETKVIHAGERRVEGSVVTPIFQSATYVHEEGKGYHDLRYLRLNNTPSQVVLHDKLAALEGAESALVTSSGMAAITTTLFALLKSGDHILAQNVLYGGTYDFITKDLPQLGITYDFIDSNDAASWNAKLKPSTKVIYVETIANPLLAVPDLGAVVKFAKSRGLVSAIDNTFASPVVYQPVVQGFDLSLHSCTKYMNGHSDLVAGAVIGGREIVEKVKHKLDHLGGSLDPHACFLLQRGIKTLALRVRAQSENAMAIAKCLVEHGAVERVYYPGLATHASHAMAAKSFRCGFGGMVSFDIKGGNAAANRFVKCLKLPIDAPSLGGVDSLVSLPAQSSHANLTPEARARAGIGDGLVRLSVGIEGTDDLVADVRQALG